MLDETVARKMRLYHIIDITSYIYHVWSIKSVIGLNMLIHLRSIIVILSINYLY